MFCLETTYLVCSITPVSGLSVPELAVFCVAWVLDDGVWLLVEDAAGDSFLSPLWNIDFSLFILSASVENFQVRLS